MQTTGAFPAGTTELAAAAASGITSSGNDWRAVLKGLRAKLPNSGQRMAVFYDPVEASGASAATTTPGATAPGAEAARPSVDPGGLTAADYRRIQLALQRLGYYAGKVDGVVGSDTMAAIRRFQHELRAEMSGQLTKEQSERLLKDSQ